ncbi:MAG TPA: HlyD family efflux transporter periplasmic adaptor subunit [Burkholderiales bacterium]|nr:HlyD family efflux transporter periplasmic adaptor subunit [Burkholderiales bacterium]
MRRLALRIAPLVVLAAIAVWALLPEPIAVEIGEARRGPMRVTVDQQAEVRVHDRYVVAAPVPGKLVRVDLHDGAPVTKGQVVAVLEPTPMDPVERQEVLARLEAARARVTEAARNAEQAQAALAQTRRDRARTEQLVAERFISSEAAEKARTIETTAVAALEAARARERAARFDAQAAEAALLAADTQVRRPGRLVSLAAPATGRVLRVAEKSERSLPAGTPIMTIGDPSRLEIVADVLSTDAVKIAAGAEVLIDQWGGDRVLKGRVRLVEPYAYTKVSALGIEEKRVNVIIDPVETLEPLGDGYRVETRIVVWSAPDVLKIPASALFRANGAWHVFSVADDRATRRAIEVGHRNPDEAEVLSGLDAGARVVLYPPGDLALGSRVTPRR